MAGFVALVPVSCNIGSTGSGGGTITVSNVSTLKALTEPTPNTSQIVFVQSRKAWFSWDPNSTLTANDLDVVALDGVATGRYIRLNVTHRGHQLQGTWYIDPTNGSDDNLGNASNAALQTTREFALRMAGVITISTTVNYLGTPAASDPISMALYAAVDYAANSNSVTITLTLVGAKTTIRSGTMSSVTALARGTNTIGTITDASATWATSITNNYRIDVTSGAANGLIMWPTRDAGSNTVEVNNPVNSTTGAEGTFPSASATYNEVSLTSASFAISTNVAVRVDDFNISATGFVISQGSVQFRGCVVGNLQAANSPSIAIIGCRDGSTTALQSALPGRVQVVGCSFSKGAYLVRANQIVNFSVSLFNTVGLRLGAASTGSGLSTLGSGFASIVTTGIFNVSGFGLRVCHGGYASVTAATLYGQGNTTGVSAEFGGKIVIANGVTPTITGTTEISIDSTANLFGPLEQYSGVWDATTAVASCDTWAEWNAAPFSRYATCYRTLAGIVSA